MPWSDKKISLSEIVCHFEQLEDPRSPVNRHHPLPSVLTIALMGVLAGSDGPTAISRWAVAKKHLLIQSLDRKRPSNPFLPVWIVFGPVNSGFRTFSGEVRYERAGAGLA